MVLRITLPGQAVAGGRAVISLFGGGDWRPLEKGENGSLPPIAQQLRWMH